MTNIIQLKNKEPVTTSLIIAEGIGRKHKNIIEIIEKYKNDIEDVGGTFAFQTRKSGGRETRYAVLNGIVA